MTGGLSLITPKDIEEKKFSKQVKGYSRDEVDQFLDDIILEMETLLSDNKRLLDRIDILQNEIEERKKSEASVVTTLESAKKIMKDISESAERRAEMIIKSANMDAEAIKHDAKESVADISRNWDDLKMRVGGFRERYCRMLEEELEHARNFDAGLTRDMNNDKIESSLSRINEQAKDIRLGEVSVTDTSSNNDSSSVVENPEVSLSDKNNDDSNDDLMREIFAEDEMKASIYKPKKTVVLNEKTLQEMVRQEEEKMKADKK